MSSLSNMTSLKAPEVADPFAGCVNVQAEQALLGYILRSPNCLDELDITASCFSEPMHQAIFELIVQTRLESGVVSPLLLGDKLGERVYVTKLIASAIAVDYPKEYAETLMNLWAAREMVKACLDAQAKLSYGVEAADVATELSAKVNNTVERRSWLKIRDNFQVTEEILEDMKRDVRPISTGYKRIDNAMGGGLHPGFSYGFAARKKVGKTVLASSISFNLNEAGVEHLFIACEMGSKQIHQRNLARATGLSARVFRDTSQQTTQALAEIGNHAVKANRCIYYLDAPSMTFSDLKQAVSVARGKHKIQGVILDYWQLIGGKPKAKSTAEHLDEVAQWIADYCRKYGLWSIVMAQINQDGNTRGSEGMRLAFDQVYQLHREDVSMPGAWLEMLDTRYTAWGNVGEAERPSMYMADNAPYFYEV